MVQIHSFPSFEAFSRYEPSNEEIVTINNMVLLQLGTLCLFGVFKYEFSFRAYRIQTDVFFFFSFYFILTTKNWKEIKFGIRKIIKFGKMSDIYASNHTSRHLHIHCQHHCQHCYHHCHRFVHPLEAMNIRTLIFSTLEGIVVIRRRLTSDT